MISNTFTKNDSVKIKGVAIILTLIHHCFLSPDRYKGQNVIFAPFSEASWNEWGLFFKICVPIFVFISAYGFTISFKNIEVNFRLSKEKVIMAIVTRYSKVISSYMFVFVCLQIYSLILQKGRYTYIYGNKLTSIIYMCIDMFGLANILGTPTFIATFWYMSFAQIVIFLVPFYIAIYKRWGGIILVTSAFLMTFLPQYKYVEFPRYLICIALGVLCADKDFFSMLKNISCSLRGIQLCVVRIIKFIIFILLIYEMKRLREGELKEVLLPIFDAVIPIIIIGFFIEFVNPLPVVANILEVIGKHSMNIFLIHNFIRVVWYYDFTYSFSYAGVIVLVLLGISLLISVCLEWIKKIIHFNQIVDCVIRHIVGKYALTN